MSRAKHTPGPWAARGKYVFAGGDCIGICDTDNASDGRTEANARLIAAAPDLLAVAKECIDLAKLAESLCGCRGDDDYVWGIQERLEAAIAKAEGRHD